MRPRSLFLPLLVFVAGCRLFGGGPEDTGGTVGHGYDYDHALLWQGITEAMLAEEYTLRVADAVAGRIRTEPRVVREGDAYQVSVDMNGREHAWTLTVRVRHLVADKRGGWTDQGDSPVLEQRILDKIDAKARELYQAGMQAPVRPRPRR